MGVLIWSGYGVLDVVLVISSMFGFFSLFQGFDFPVDTWPLYNVALKSMQHQHDVASTLMRRCINGMCPLGSSFLLCEGPKGGVFVLLVVGCAYHPPTELRWLIWNLLCLTFRTSIKSMRLIWVFVSDYVFPLFCFLIITFYFHLWSFSTVFFVLFRISFMSVHTIFTLTSRTLYLLSHVLKFERPVYCHMMCVRTTGWGSNNVDLDQTSQKLHLSCNKRTEFLVRRTANRLR